MYVCIIYTRRRSNYVYTDTTCFRGVKAVRKFCSSASLRVDLNRHLLGLRAVYLRINTILIAALPITPGVSDQRRRLFIFIFRSCFH